MSRRSPFPRGLRVPRPPAELEGKVLAAALGTVGGGGAEHWIDRLFASRRLRLAWLGTVALLALLSGRLPPPADPPVSLPMVPTYRGLEAVPEIPELRSLLHLRQGLRGASGDTLGERLEKLAEVRRETA